MIVQYTSEALGSLDSLGISDPSLDALVADELDRFEADPGLTRWKRKAYGGVAPRTYGFDVRGWHGDCLVLWQQTTDILITVVYVGEPI